MTRENSWRLTAASTAIVVSLAACTSGTSDAPTPARPTATTQGPSQAAPAPTARPADLSPPKLDADEALAGSAQPTRGNASMEYTPGKKGKALIVAVRCQGKGEIKVTVPSVHVTFPLTCVEGEASTTYNQVAVKGAERGGTVSIEAPSTIRWSLTIGRGTPAETETPRST